MSDTSGIQPFFQGLGSYLGDYVRQATEASSFHVGDGVRYHGSKVADHGYWRVQAVPGNGTVEIGRRGERRYLVVRPQSIDNLRDEVCRHCDAAEVWHYAMRVDDIVDGDLPVQDLCYSCENR